MRRPPRRATLLPAAAALLLGAGDAEAYVTDAVEHAPVNYRTFRPPAAGRSYIDPVFGTVVKRLTRYSGEWLTDFSSDHSQGSAVLGREAVDRVDFAFLGTGVSWIGYRDERSGTARVSLDRVLRAEIDTHAPEARSQEVIYTLTGLPRGMHTLTVRPARARSPGPAEGRVWVDGFEVLP